MSQITDISALVDQDFSNASFQVIKSLQAKVLELQQKNEQLLSLIEQNTPTLIHTQDINLSGISKEQIICEVQIEMLKNEAVVRQLTKEEAQKFQIFVDILAKYKTVEKNPEAIHVESMTNEQLAASLVVK